MRIEFKTIPPPKKKSSAYWDVCLAFKLFYSRIFLNAYLCDWKISSIGGGEDGK